MNIDSTTRIYIGLYTGRDKTGRDAVSAIMSTKQKARLYTSCTLSAHPWKQTKQQMENYY